MGWIGCDLDCTLAEYSPKHNWASKNIIGPPIKLMVDRIKKWIEEGKEVRIFTARVSHPKANGVEAAIHAWCLKHIGQELKVTCIKDWECIQIWDDRAVAVERNTGKILGGNNVEMDS